jgi:hypothetical protein
MCTLRTRSLEAFLAEGRDLNCSGNHNISPSARVADLINSLPCGKLFKLALSGLDGLLLFIREGEERNLF